MSAPFEPGFFERFDDGPDAAFYAPPRFVTHIDDAAVAAVGELYEELRIGGRVLDLMSSWVSHFVTPPEHLTVLGMNERELRANGAAAEVAVQDLNARPVLPFADGAFDHAVCCVSVDYLTQPLAVFAEVARVLRPGGLFVVTFSDRCFSSKAIRGWLATDDAGRVRIVRRYFRLSGCFGPATSDLRTPPHAAGDPLYAVWAPSRRTGRPGGPPPRPAAARARPGA